MLRGAGRKIVTGALMRRYLWEGRQEAERLEEEDVTARDAGAGIGG